MQKMSKLELGYRGDEVIYWDEYLHIMLMLKYTAYIML